MNSHHKLILLISVITLILSSHSSLYAKDKKQKSKPNFIIIFADDQGYQDVGCFGSPLIKTPHLDKMAKEGMRFTDFYSASSVCTPSRAALLTGCYPPRVSMPRVLFPNSKTGLNPKENTIADILKKQGYATACIGKWHLGHKPDFLPTRHGFDLYYGVPYSNDMQIDPKAKLSKNIKLNKSVTLDTIKPKRHWVPLMRQEEVIEYPVDQSQLTKKYTQEAIKFITTNKNRPFFLYLPHTMPHIPLFASKQFKGKSKRGLYGDVIEEMDWSVGEILSTLKKQGLDENTLVIYTSDNGPWLRFGKNGGSALPLRDGKFSTYEGGMREPCIIRWPKQIPSGTTCAEVCGTIDLLPTLAKLSGATLPQDNIIDGKDIWPLLSGTKGAKSPHDAYYYYRPNSSQLQAVRRGKWKLRISQKRKQKTNKIELFDLSEDISEKNNIAQKNPEVVKQLSKLMTDFDRELKSKQRPAGHYKTK